MWRETNSNILRILALKMNNLLNNDLLNLRAPEPEDIDLLYSWENDTSLWENGATLVPFSRHSIKQYLIDNKHDIFVDRQLRLIAVLRGGNIPVGAVDLYDFDPFHRRACVGILIDRNHRRKGYALQALSLLETYAFGFLNMKQLYAIVPEKNHASVDLFTKAGYRKSGVLEEWLALEDTYSNALLMQKIKP